ncbi:Vacuolar protein sorting/targeting protein 10 [Frankliniella fusca]|uniref:Vacuolar protein sorting/targeting protein 10 n=1 Tax=Frankliniella fusca TaxID=407009 RepID=A0AAE1GQY7_9NEOP|nr:Vacuolar protein sorting/targeting protein 10 [Frankliniella fusca]
MVMQSSSDASDRSSDLLCNFHKSYVDNRTLRSDGLTIASIKFHLCSLHCKCCLIKCAIQCAEGNRKFNIVFNIPSPHDKYEGSKVTD